MSVSPEPPEPQVGGGIVADSDPEAEYQETLDKARALLEAIAEARALVGANPAADAAGNTATP